MWDPKINTSVISEFLKYYKTSFLVSVVFCRLFVPVWASLSLGLGNFLLQCYCWHSACYPHSILCLCLWFGNLIFCGVPKRSRVLFICFFNFPLTFTKWSNSSSLTSHPDSVFKIVHSINDVFYWGELAFLFVCFSLRFLLLWASELWPMASGHFSPCMAHKWQPVLLCQPKKPRPTPAPRLVDKSIIPGLLKEGERTAGSNQIQWWSSKWDRQTE